MSGRAAARGTARRRRGVARPRLDPLRVAVARLGDEAVLFDLRTYGAARANGAAARLVGLADGSRTVPDLARALAADFGIPRPRALLDVRRLLGELERRGFLRPRGTRRGR